MDGVLVVDGVEYFITQGLDLMMMMMMNNIPSSDDDDDDDE